MIFVAIFRVIIFVNLVFVRIDKLEKVEIWFLMKN